MLGVNFNLERLYRREHGDRREAAPDGDRLAACSRRVYAVVYGPQDRLVEAFVEWRLRRLRADARRSASPTTTARTLAVLANFGLSTQLAALRRLPRARAPRGLPLARDRVRLALVPLELRRELRAALRSTGVPRRRCTARSA